MTRSTSEHITVGVAAHRERAARARARLRRGVLLLALAGIAYAAVAVWQRDTTHMKNAVERLKPFQRTLQAALDASGRLPLKLSETDPNGKALPTKVFTYLPIEDIRTLRQFDGDVLVGYSASEGLALRCDGRAALLCDKGRCSIRWLTSTELTDSLKKQRAWIEGRQRELREQGPKLP
ncbi:MAG: hypothetical protein V2A79_19560 [Planctomycetota bacterium]